MKKDVAAGVKVEMKNQLYYFNSLIYGMKRAIDQEMNEAFSKIDEMVDAGFKHNKDFDLIVCFRYRNGKRLSKSTSIKELEPVRLIDAIHNGFDISDEASMVLIEIKGVFQSGYERKVVNEPFFKIKDI